MTSNVHSIVLNVDFDFVNVDFRHVYSLLEFQKFIRKFKNLSELGPPL